MAADAGVDAGASDAGDFILFYGSLMSTQAAYTGQRLDDSLRRIGSRTIRGILYDLGDYPGLVLNGASSTDSVVAELHEIRDLKVLLRMDDFEEYDRRRPDCLYRRTMIQLPRYTGRFKNLLVRRTPLCRFRSPDIDAWVYVYNRPVAGWPRITAASWPEHLEGLAAVDPPKPPKTAASGLSVAPPLTSQQG